MTRIFNNSVYYSSKEIAKKVGGTPASWRYRAHRKKVPAVKWIDGNWYFNLDEIEEKTVKANRNM